MTKNDADERTTSIGLFNQAESYRRSAFSLRKSKDDRWVFSNDPIYFLYSHSAELFLKSYLRQFLSVSELKNLGHSLKRLYKESTSNGMDALPATNHLISHFDLSVFASARYIKTGYYSMPTIELMSYVSAELCEEASKVHEEEFAKAIYFLDIPNLFKAETFDISKI